MHAPARPFATGSVALVASSLIAVTPAMSPAGLRVANMDVRLVDNALTDVAGALGNIDPLSSLGGLSLPDLGSLDPSGLDLGGLANVPYNLFADIVNIPYNESVALGILATALGPAGQSVLPAGADAAGITTVTESGLPVIEGPVGPGGALEPLGIAGTGSWWMESLGNTWGWDDGNFAQVDAVANLLVPFPAYSTAVAEELQVIAEAEIVDGAKVNCEFECADPLGYLGTWFHVPLTQLLSGYTFGDVLANTIGQNSSTGIVNVGPDSPFTVWSGTTAVLNPLFPFESLAANLTGSPADNPIEIPTLQDLITPLTGLSNDFMGGALFNNPFQTGSYLYWGAPTLYVVPALLGGLVQDFTGIPNQFINPDINPIPAIGWQPFGAEPISGYTDGPSSLLQGLPAGFEYLVQGLLAYLNPEIYLDALSADLGGLDPSALTGLDPSTLLGSLDPSTLLGSLDPTTLAGDLSTLLASGATNTAATVIPDLALQLLTSF
jgi:hypothetical protein